MDAESAMVGPAVEEGGCTFIGGFHDPASVADVIGEGE